MTEQTVPAILDSILEPLAKVLIKLNRALHIAKAYNLPAAYVQTITKAKDDIDDSWETLQQIVTSLDPDIYKHEL